jgi:hypothetical protein
MVFLYGSRGAWPEGANRPVKGPSVPGSAIYNCARTAGVTPGSASAPVAQLDRGSYYLWEGGTGFGMRLYRSGRRTWVCATAITNRETGKHTSRFFTLGKIPDMSLKEGQCSRLDEEAAV